MRDIVLTTADIRKTLDAIRSRYRDDTLLICAEINGYVVGEFCTTFCINQNIKQIVKRRKFRDAKRLGNR